MEVEWNAHRRELGAGIAATRAVMTKLHAERSAVPNGQDSLHLPAPGHVHPACRLPPAPAIVKTDTRQQAQTADCKIPGIVCFYFLLPLHHLFSPGLLSRARERRLWPSVSRTGSQADPAMSKNQAPRAAFMPGRTGQKRSLGHRPSEGRGEDGCIPACRPLGIVTREARTATLWTVR